jgi:hypothetical protein
MNAAQIESSCSHLSSLLINTIRTKILKKTELPKQYTFGEALVFFMADLLLGNKLLTAEQLRVVLEEFQDRIMTFGLDLESAWYVATPKGIDDLKRLPVCKLGILDRQLVCMDGCDFFVNVTSGERVPAVNNMPLELIAYNLTTLFVRSRTRLNSAELGG